MGHKSQFVASNEHRANTLRGSRDRVKNERKCVQAKRKAADRQPRRPRSVLVVLYFKRFSTSFLVGTQCVYTLILKLVQFKNTAQTETETKQTKPKTK